MHELHSGSRTEDSWSWQPGEGGGLRDPWVAGKKAASANQGLRKSMRELTPSPLLSVYGQPPHIPRPPSYPGEQDGHLPTFLLPMEDMYTFSRQRH